MDLSITITDENGTVLRDIQIYKDGSDSQGAELIAKAIKREVSDRRNSSWVAARLLDIVDLIEEFDEECSNKEHTDLGDAWTLFGEVTEIAKNTAVKLVGESRGN